MNYRQEKEKAAAKGRKIKAIILAIVVFLTAGLCIFSAFYPASTWKYYVGLPDVPKRKEGELRIHFLDVGQGDCTLIEFPDGRTMMIGAYENNSAIYKRLEDRYLGFSLAHAFRFRPLRRIRRDNGDKGSENRLYS